MRVRYTTCRNSNYDDFFITKYCDMKSVSIDIHTINNNMY
jgi:hypothetical protein